jgi:type IV secretion system protein VirB10
LTGCLNERSYASELESMRRKLRSAMKIKGDKASIESPTGLDLKPQPKQPVRVSKHASMVIVAVAVVLLGLLGYGGYKRTKQQQIAAQQSGAPSEVTPATQAAQEFVTATPAGNAPFEAKVNPAPAPQLQPPGQHNAHSASAACGLDPRTNQPYRFNPETGRPCGASAPAAHASATAAYAANPGPAVTQAVQQMEQQSQLTPQQQILLAAYKREHDAMMAPTGVKVAESSTAVSAAARQPELAGVSLIPGLQAKQTLLQAHQNQDKDYLSSTRTAPASPYEIQAGWEIPAVLEQELNSDLPGQLKALVMENVYDTATGKFLLVPQGSRLIGKYDSRVAYGQNGVQVAWNRLIYPDGSFIDLEGMEGLDSHGNAGLRDKVDNHYGRLFGMTALTTLFSAGLGISQYRSQSVLSYPTPGEMASSAIAQELSNSGNQITRKNLNVQPTIKVPPGYKFNVRVDRDIVFPGPYIATELEQQRFGAPSPDAETVQKVSSR